MSGDGAARGFPAFPARKGGRTRGQSWWGKAWIAAMEESALDPEPLKKGRAYARSGRVGSITVSPGRISAPVHDSGEETAHTTVVTVEQLDEDAWTRFLEQTAARSGHLAELLAGEMPQQLADDAEDLGVRLLPGIGDLEPDCDCDSWDHPCEHAAALCYQASWLLDEDPFVLLLMRGRDKQTLVEELQWLNVRGPLEPEEEPEEEESEEEASAEELAASAPAAPPVQGTPAREAYAVEAPELPQLPPLPDPALPPEPTSGIELDPLERLVTDAAVRARELLAYARGEAHEPGPPLDAWRDSVRIAAATPDPRLHDRLSRAAGGNHVELDRAVLAWRYGGAEGLEVLERAWSPPKQELARARAALESLREEGGLPAMQESRNRWTVTGRGLQLRYGRDGRWHPYREESGTWWPAAPPGSDPADVLSALLSAD